MRRLMKAGGSRQMSEKRRPWASSSARRSKASPHRPSMDLVRASSGALRAAFSVARARACGEASKKVTERAPAAAAVPPKPPA